MSKKTEDIKQQLNVFELNQSQNFLILRSFFRSQVLYEKTVQFKLL